MKLPEEVGIMVLPGLVFFPHYLAPLHIFEPRYRQMLAKALDSHRMFAICHGASSEEPCEVGGVGIIRACVQNPDGTSNLILQGCGRVRFSAFTQMRPYFVGVPIALENEQGPPTVEEEALVERVVEMVSVHARVNEASRLDVVRFLHGLKDLNALVDIIAGNFLHCAEKKQLLLEEESRVKRLHLLAQTLHAEQAGSGARE